MAAAAQAWRRPATAAALTVGRRLGGFTVKEVRLLLLLQRLGRWRRWRRWRRRRRRRQDAARSISGGLTQTRPLTPAAAAEDTGEGRAPVPAHGGHPGAHLRRRAHPHCSRGPRACLQVRPPLGALSRPAPSGRTTQPLTGPLRALWPRSIIFKTVPRSSNGVPHILEHNVLCGSRAFPDRDPFFKMLNRSLATYMNALTASDHTMYPFSTLNATDYRNLLAVYLDATLSPLLRPLDFYQEGWRLEHAVVDGRAADKVGEGTPHGSLTLRTGCGPERRRRHRSDEPAGVQGRRVQRDEGRDGACGRKHCGPEAKSRRLTWKPGCPGDGSLGCGRRTPPRCSSRGCSSICTPARPTRTSRAASH